MRRCIGSCVRCTFLALATVFIRGGYSQGGVWGVGFEVKLASTVTQTRVARGRARV
jgi:hypothetical protein